MWCYQKPDFEALLVTELQRQQQRRQFCDTLLKAEDVSVPVHSCVLSAISPQISSALSSTPAPPAGQNRLLEFRTLGRCTLLRLAHFFYSGEMVGEGESERQEAISAAAELGIHGLVEVPRTQVDSRQPGQQVEVGVQTESLPEKQESGASRRKAVGDGCNLLLRDTWAQTEEPQVSVAYPPQPSTSLETIDVTSIQTAHSSLLHEQIPYIPLSLLYTPEEHQTYQLSSAPVHFLQESTASGHRSATVLTPPPHTMLRPLPPLSPPPNQAALGDVSPPERWDNSNLEEFHGNIPGYISHFLNPPSEKNSKRGHPRGRRPAAGRGAKKAGAPKEGTSKPRGRKRGRGGLTETVEVQDVGVSKLQKSFLQRWRTKLSRTGQGGGAAGRSLCLKSREVLKSARRSQSRGAPLKMWTFCPSKDPPPYKEEVSGGTNHLRKKAKKPTNQHELPVIQPHETCPRSAASRAFFTPPAHLRNIPPTSSSSSSVQPLLSPRLGSSASSALCSTPAPAAAAPHGEERHIDHLLEEVMRGLNIMPTNNATTQTVAASVLRGGGNCSTESSETLVVQQQQQQQQQQQGEGELNDILDRFLMTFEQHINNSAAWEEVSTHGSAEVGEQGTNTRQQMDVDNEPPPNNLQPPKTQRGTQDHKHTVATLSRKSARTRSTSSLKNNRVHVGNHLPPGVKAKKVSPYSQDKQLQQIAVVKLERRGLLPLQVNLQNPNSVNPKSLPGSLITSSRVKQDTNDSSKKKNASLPRKSYPIRSKMRNAQLDPDFYLEQPLDFHICTRQKSRLRQPSRCTEKESGSRHQQRREAETRSDTGSKRTAEEAEPVQEAPLGKRIRVAGKQPTGSPVALTVPADDEIIDVETVSGSSAAEGAVTGLLASDFGLGESEEEEEEEDADEVISVGGVDCGQTGCDQRSSARSPEDTEIDVIGGFGLCPTPETLTWAQPSEDEEEEGVAIIESQDSTVCRL